MNHVPFPLIIPVNEEQQLYQGYIPIHDTEYYIQVQLGSCCFLQGNVQLLELYNAHPDKHLIQSKLEQATDIMTFLTEFKEILETTCFKNETFQYSHDRYTFIYHELTQIGFDKVLFISKDITEITFQHLDSENRKHELKVKIPLHYPMALPQVTYDLPTHLAVNAACCSLPQLVSEHARLVQKYQALFHGLDLVDRHMRVVEPETPRRKDCWRRIALGYHCTLEMEVNPETPYYKPKASFFGSVSRVNELKSTWHQYTWDKEMEMYENLMGVFQLKTEKQEDYLNTGDIECGICYSYKLNHANIPDVICSNDLCSRGFHHACLYEWLRGNPSTTQSFNVLFGKCPYCNEKITIHTIKP